MKHYIISKFKPEFKDQLKEMLPDITALFNNAHKLDGVTGVQVIPNIIDRANRYDLMIVIEMNKDTLPVYDDSEFHHQWKEQYGGMLESKALFDAE